LRDVFLGGLGALSLSLSRSFSPYLSLYVSIAQVPHSPCGKLLGGTSAIEALRKAPTALYMLVSGMYTADIAGLSLTRH
jgi:hypothetical protein